MQHLTPFNEAIEPFRREFDCLDIVRATNFVKRIMYLAENRNHHPSILVNRFHVTVELFTHDENKVTDDDIDMMQDITKIFQSL